MSSLIERLKRIEQLVIGEEKVVFRVIEKGVDEAAADADKHKDVLLVTFYV